MKRLICISIATLLTLPLLCQEDKIQKLENLEKNTEAKTDRFIKSEKYSPEQRMTLLQLKVGDEFFSVKEIGDETRIRIGKKEFRVVENDNGVTVIKNSSKNSHRRESERFKGSHRRI